MVNDVSQDDLEILQHVSRYRLTTPEILAATGLLSNAEAALAASELQRLVDDGWLVSRNLTPEWSSDDHIYYQLTPRAAERLGHDPAFAAPLSRDARIECYAIAKFCCCGDRFRWLFTKQEFQQQFESLWFPGQPVRYHLERPYTGPDRLAFLKVDTDGAGRWDRLIDSCSRFLQQRTAPKHVAVEHHKQVLAFAQLVERGLFQFTILVPLAEKQRSIALELERRAAKGEPVPPIQTHVVPGLFELLFAPGATDTDRVEVN